MNNLKEHPFPYQSFIGGWYIPEDVCDDLINYAKLNFNNFKNGCLGGGVVDKETKDSLDLPIYKYDNEDIIVKYRQNLQKVLLLYEQKYDELKILMKYDIIENFNLQYYPPNGGFKKWHNERSFNRNRNLVFMTFLNNVPDGGTLFKYQQIACPAKKGLTLIWPTDWTHTHKGQVSSKYEKYIITGWYGYCG
jgi:hypothetical protein